MGTVCAKLCWIQAEHKLYSKVQNSSMQWLQMIKANEQNKTMKFQHDFNVLRRYFVALIVSESEETTW